MDTDTVIMPKVHQGRNIKRFRDVLGVKQETLAIALNMTQQAFPKLEQKEVIDEKTLSKVAETLQIPVAALKNMPDEMAINIIANTFNNNDAAGYNNQCTFNLSDKVVGLLEHLIDVLEAKIK